ncbi:Outer mitochondrial transmembrane helix translocase [Linum perenne]
MEQKQFLLSALGVGVGVGVGLGLASPTVSKWTGVNVPPTNAVTGDKLEQELLRQVIHGRESGVTFAEFPYYLSEQTRVLLTSAAYVHLKHAEVSKYTRNLSPASRTILLSGPAETYQQMLVKALAHYFDAKLLLLDVTDFSLKIQSKYGTTKDSDQSFRRSTSMERLSGFLESFSILPQDMESRGNCRVAGTGTLRRQHSGVDLSSSRGLEGSSNFPKLRRNASASANMNLLASQSASASTEAPLRRQTSLSFDEKLLIQSLYKVLAYVSKSSPIVLYLRDVDKFLSRSQRIYNLFNKMLKKLSGSVLILGSRSVDLENDNREPDDMLTLLFPYNIEIKPPQDENQHLNWKSQLEEDMKMIQVQDNRNHIMEVLSSNDLDCDDLDCICMADTVVLGNYIEEIVVSAISYHLMNNRDPDYRSGKLIISSKSLSHGLSIFQEGKSVGNNTLKLEAQAELPKAAVKPETKADTVIPEKKADAGIPSAVKSEADAALPTPSKTEVQPDNEFEKRIRPEVIPANEINVTFADIGSLEETKESLQELVMLPLRRPDLFKGGLLKPCRGILLFGPPGTGKTMLAKAIAREAGASFINVSMSTITSKWFGEDEKNVRALFTLASKVSPTIIFVDEVDSMLGQRTRVGEHEAMRKIKNEFMTHWDGLATKQGERILVLAATNRPFDLDEAIIRRFERRIMVGLPSVENREMILKTLLSKEKVDERLDFKEVATLTDGFSGSDLKQNLCTTAAYRPVRELIQQERKRDMVKFNTFHNVQEKKKKAAEAQGGAETGERVVTLRALNMEDFRLAKNQVAASLAAEGSIMSELKQWNDQYGEGGSRKKEQLSYFL